MRTFFTTLALLALTPQIAGAKDSFNALWNDNGPSGLVGVWIYPVKGDCPSLRNKAKPVVLAMKTARSEQNVSDLSYCFQLPPTPDSTLISCHGGKLHLELDAATRRYKGIYSFSMTDGSKREGTFVAQYCPYDSKPGTPAPPAPPAPPTPPKGK